jgi:hypothetical protein
MTLETAARTCSMLLLDRCPGSQAVAAVIMTVGTGLQRILGSIDARVIAYTGMAISICMVREVPQGVAGGTVTLDTDAML